MTTSYLPYEPQQQMLLPQGNFTDSESRIMNLQRNDAGFPPKARGNDGVAIDGVAIDGVGIDAVGIDAVGNDAVGNDAVGNDVVGNDVVGNDVVAES